MARAIPLTSEITARSYHVELTVEHMLAVLDYDDACPRGEELVHLLEDARAIRVEYDGHFGPMIYFTFELDEDTPRNHLAVHKAIRKAINAGHRLPAFKRKSRTIIRLSGEKA